MSEHEKVRQAVSLSLTAGYHLDKEAFNLLTIISKAENPIKLIEAALKNLEIRTEKPLFISKSLLEEIAKETFLETKPLTVPILPEPSLVTGKAKKTFHPHAKDIKKDIKILEDPTGKICSTGSIDQYLEYFQDRFKRIRKLLRQRMDSRNAASIKDAFRAASRSRVKIFCMITGKRESKYGVFLKIEDLESSATALIPRNASQGLLKNTKSLLPDQVVCLSLMKSRKNLLIVEELILPDIPKKKPRKAKEMVSVALISDLHVGSKEFMREEFNRFVLWLNGKYGNESLQEAASHVKYVIIAGDIVDGIGIYPNQIKELAVQDIFKQYKLAAKFFEQIPDYIELIIIPGNHDASRKALPQPAIPKVYAEPLYETRSILSLGNPATVTIHGVEFLIYHGRSLDDVLATAADMDFHSPERAMRLLLRGRHLAPTYGQRTSISPEKRDFLVIERVPDVFHVGHVHVMKYESYRGTLMVNSGAWQKQTNYQRNLGLEPTPGIIPVVNLQTIGVLPIDFNA
ncbi:MAG: DNA-directed DNA polymerase II small subunit [Candidatus Bathyarchaeota archaeon]|nr:DNA-directed DNA polymerase II small subunit [Candidatus Bathyarchaeota archaeon]MDH5494360.1 DNA-directed DNA polymerase II small subunit [Candidatus Bathyarchaeota archaeon]